MSRTPSQSTDRYSIQLQIDLTRTGRTLEWFLIRQASDAPAERIATFDSFEAVAAAYRRRSGSPASAWSRTVSQVIERLIK